MNGALAPTRDHTITERSKNYRYSTHHQVVIDADTRLVVAVGRPLPGNRNDCRAWELSGAKEAVGKTTVIADGGYRGTGLVIRTAARKDRPNSRPGGGTQRLPPQGPRPRRARLRPDEDLKDPSRLPSQRRRRPARNARHCPSAQPRPCRVTQKPAVHPARQRSFTGQPLSRPSPRSPTR
ncbi:transposase [Streptomyces tirandamycinicus]